MIIWKILKSSCKWKKLKKISKVKWKIKICNCKFKIKIQKGKCAEVQTQNFFSKFNKNLL